MSDERSFLDASFLLGLCNLRDQPRQSALRVMLQEG